VFFTSNVKAFTTEH